MINSELKWAYASLVSAVLFSIICIVFAFTTHADLQLQLLKHKRMKLRESGALLSALDEQRRFAAIRESYEAVMANANRISHDRLSLLGYLSVLNAEVAPLTHSFSIGSASSLDKVDRHLASARVSVIELSAEFRHENHLFEYLWHIDQQQIALLKVIAVDVSKTASEPRADDRDASHLIAVIRLQWFSISASEVS